MRGLIEKIAVMFRRLPPWGPPAQPSTRLGREPVDHVLLFDGTMGSLKPHQVTSIGLLYQYLRRSGLHHSLYYGKGLQWREWRELSDLWFGWGVNRQIQRAYGWLAMRYRPGDRVFLIGYSRGAFAARSLAGMIERVGLLRSDAAIERNVSMAWRHYEGGARPETLQGFKASLCHDACPIEMVGAFDTVMGLGFQLPLLWMLSEPRYRFHDHHLGPSVKHGFQALAIEETRSIFEPLIWDCEGTGAGRVEQVWFRGCHGDIGGQLSGREESRPLANIPLVWMLERAEELDFALPDTWREDFPTDPAAPSVGSWSGWGKLFLFRAPRIVGRDPSERVHESAIGARRSWQTILVPGVLRRTFQPSPAEAPAAPSGSGGHDEAGGRAGGIESPVRRPTDLAAGDAG